MDTGIDNTNMADVAGSRSANLDNLPLLAIVSQNDACRFRTHQAAPCSNVLIITWQTFINTHMIIEKEARCVIQNPRLLR